jgi:hypothetical protein
MKIDLWVVMIGVLVLIGSCSYVYGADGRFCGVVVRDVNPPHSILRSTTVKNNFKKEWPCTFPCTSTWQIDHVIPLDCGGCDSVENMQWLPREIKTCAVSVNPFCKDRWELKLYCGRPVTTVFK